MGRRFHDKVMAIHPDIPVRLRVNLKSFFLKREAGVEAATTAPAKIIPF